jgi:hypothetical protein
MATKSVVERWWPCGQPFIPLPPEDGSPLKGSLWKMENAQCKSFLPPFSILHSPFSIVLSAPRAW